MATTWRQVERPGRWLPGLLVAGVLLAVGTGALIYLTTTARQPSGQPDPDTGRLVRVFRATKAPHQTAITAFGQARASKVWNAIAEVEGKALEVADRFEPGEFLEPGTLLVRIDPTDYDLAIDLYDAQARARAEQIEELNQQQKNLTAIQKLRDQQAQIALADYKREKSVFERNAGSEASLDAARNKYIAAQTSLEEIRNSLALIPIQRPLATAEMDVAQSQLKKARADRAKCEIRLPFAARCATKSIEADQFVKSGERLGTFVNLDQIEVPAMVETRKIHKLFPGGRGSPGVVDFGDIRQVRTLFDSVPLEADVSFDLDGQTHVWRGKVARVESSLDAGTRTAVAIIEVDNPNVEVIPGERPPLLPGTFCDVTIYGAHLDDVVTVPREAVHDDRVWVVRPEDERSGHLERRRVKTLLLEEDVAVIDSGLEPGELVVLSDFFPVVEGMPLRMQLEEDVIPDGNRAPSRVARQGRPPVQVAEPER